MSHGEEHNNSTHLPIGHTWSSMSANRPSSSICCSCSLDNLSPNLLGRFLQTQRIISAGRLAIHTLRKFLQEPYVPLLLLVGHADCCCKGLLSLTSAGEVHA